MVGLVKVILTGDRCGGSELAMLCMMLLILGLPLTTGAAATTCLAAGDDTLATSFSSTGDELDELVRRRLRGFSSSSEQLTPKIETRSVLHARAASRGRAPRGVIGPTFDVDGASAGQHHHAGRRAGRPRRLGGRSRGAAGCRGAAGGARRARVGVTHDHCEEKEEDRSLVTLDLWPHLVPMVFFFLR